MTTGLGVFRVWPPTRVTWLAVATLTLAVGSNLVVLTLVWALWFPERGMQEPDRLVIVSSAAADGTSMSDQLRTRDLLSLRELPALSGVAGQVGTEGLLHDFQPRLQLEGAPLLATAAVTPGYFSVLGVEIQGRDFNDADDRAAAPLVAALGENAWRTYFGARTDLVGTVLTSLHGPVQIVAIVPQSFTGGRLGDRYQLWVPAGQGPRVSALDRAPGPLAAQVVEVGRQLTPFFAIARVAPGATFVDVQRGLEGGRLIAHPLEQVHARTDGSGRRLSEGRLLSILMAAAALVLVAGCATLASSSVVQLGRRRRDIAVRLALGATQRRIVTAVCLEVAIVAGLGAVSAVAVASLALAGLRSFTLPGGLSLARVDLSIDWPLASAGVVASLGTMLMATVVPLAISTRRGMAQWLRSSGATSHGTTIRTQAVATALHAAATVLVLIAAFTLVRAVAAWQGDRSGFDLDRTLVVSVQPTAVEFARADEGEEQSGMAGRRRAAYEATMQRLGELPGVSSVALGTGPYRTVGSAISAAKVVDASGQSVELDVRFASVGPDYLRTLGIQLLAGQDLDATAAAGDVLVTRSLAHRLWGEIPALGQRVPLDGRALTVRGIIEDVYFGTVQPPSSFAIITRETIDSVVASSALQLVVRTNDAPGAVAPVVKSAIDEVFSPDTRATILPGRSLLAQQLGREQLGASFFGGFGLVGTLLALAGVFGLVRQIAQAREREFGIRLALGGRWTSLVRLLVRRALGPVAIGVIGGLLAATAFIRILPAALGSSMTISPSSYVAATAVVLVSAGLAGLAAALRVRRISPAEVLRGE